MEFCGCYCWFLRGWHSWSASILIFLHFFLHTCFRKKKSKAERHLVYNSVHNVQNCVTKILIKMAKCISPIHVLGSAQNDATQHFWAGCQPDVSATTSVYMQLSQPAHHWRRTEGLTHCLGFPVICTMTNAIKAWIATQVTHPFCSECCVLSLHPAVQPHSGLQEEWNRTVQSWLKLPASPCPVTFSTGKEAAFSGDQLSKVVSYSEERGQNQKQAGRARAVLDVAARTRGWVSVQ